MVKTSNDSPQGQRPHPSLVAKELTNPSFNARNQRTATEGSIRSSLAKLGLLFCDARGNAGQAVCGEGAGAGVMDGKRALFRLVSLHLAQASLHDGS